MERHGWTHSGARCRTSLRSVNEVDWPPIEAALEPTIHSTQPDANDQASLLFHSSTLQLDLQNRDRHPKLSTAFYIGIFDSLSISAARLQ
jgi:hypothetical protein